VADWLGILGSPGIPKNQKTNIGPPQHAKGCRVSSGILLGQKIVDLSQIYGN
jgi:hypothetical protein